MCMSLCDFAEFFEGRRKKREEKIVSQHGMT